MDLELNGKTALVTGSSAGIGAAIATALAAEGVHVAVHGRDRSRTQLVVKSIVAAGGTAYGVVGALDTDAGARGVADEATGLLGHVDILINNAGGFFARGWWDTSPTDWLDLYNSNVVSMVRLVQHLAPAMRGTGWGRIVQIASCVAEQPFPTSAEYAAAKAAIKTMTVSLAKEMGGSGVTVNSVSPGTVLTEGAIDYFVDALTALGVDLSSGPLPELVVTHLLANPTGRVGTPEDVADLCIYLASPKSGYINGANLRIDGGSNVAVN